MPKALWLSAPLLLLSAGVACAAGVNLGWDDCPGGATYSPAQTFACDNNVGAHTLVGSFVAPAGIQKFVGSDIRIEVQTGGATLPDWWGLRDGYCRAAPGPQIPGTPMPVGSLTASFDFTAGPFTCYDYWQGAAYGAVRSMPPVGNRVLIKGVVAIPANSSLIRSVAEGTHVYSFKCMIGNVKTVGSGSCGGCAAEACIVLTSIGLAQPGLPEWLLTDPVTSQYVTWQAGADYCDNLQRLTPAKRLTWGSIKSLYR